MEKHDFVNDIPRLQWACRRGMLELDVLLIKFLNEAYPQLALEDKYLFIEALSVEDPTLHAWLMGNEIPETESMRRIIAMIRQHVRAGL